MTTTRNPARTADPLTRAVPPGRPYGLVRHSLVLGRRSLVKTLRNPGQLGDAVLLPIIFLVMFVYLFGGAVAGSPRHYLQYIFPGVMTMTMIISGMMATGVNLNVDIKKGIFDRFRSLPIGRSTPLVGSVLGDLIRYVVALAVLFGFAYLLGFRVHTGLLSALAACALVTTFGFCLSWAYVLAGVVIRETAAVQSIIVLTMFPLAFGTNMVAPTRTMPGWLQAFVKVNPVTHVVDAARGLLIGGPVAGPVVQTLAWATGIIVIFAPLAVYAYRRRSG
jgi:oleandomycin transport system permease protein